MGRATKVGTALAGSAIALMSMAGTATAAPASDPGTMDVCSSAEYGLRSAKSWCMHDGTFWHQVVAECSYSGIYHGPWVSNKEESHVSCPQFWEGVTNTWYNTSG